MFCKLVHNRRNILSSNLLFVCKYSFFHFLRSYYFFDCREQLLRHCISFIFRLWLSAFSSYLLYKSNYFLIYFMCLINSLNHLSLRYFISSCLYHNNLFFGRSNCKFEGRTSHLSVTWIDYKFSINKTYLSSGTRTVKRYVRNCGSNS